jgi:lipopolysaccharide export LptBFGC system permease protein LptF
MSISDLIVKLIGIVLCLVGLGLLLSTVGINFLGIGLAPWWAALLTGLVFLACGVVLLKGGRLEL